MNVQSRMTKKKLLDFFPSVDGSPIPQQNHRPPEMFEQAFKESTDIQTCEIACAKPKIKGQAPSFGGHRKTTEGRNSVLLIEMVKERGLPLGCPGTSDIRNKQKPGFIEEDQMGPKSFGFFLYGASGNASNGQSLLRSFAMLDARVSDNSIPSLIEASRRGRGDIEPQTPGRSLWLSGSKSIGLSDNRRPGDPSGATLPIGSSGTWTAWEDAQGWAWGAALRNPSLDMFETSETPSLQMHLRPVPLPTDFCPLLTAGWPAGVAFPTAARFHRVSCIIVYLN